MGKVVDTDLRVKVSLTYLTRGVAQDRPSTGRPQLTSGRCVGIPGGYHSPSSGRNVWDGRAGRRDHWAKLSLLGLDWYADRGGQGRPLLATMTMQTAPCDGSSCLHIETAMKEFHACWQLAWVAQDVL